MTQMHSLGSPMAQVCEGCNVAGLLPPKLGQCCCPLGWGLQIKQEGTLRCFTLAKPSRAVFLAQLCPQPVRELWSLSCRPCAIFFLIRAGPSGWSLQGQ